MVPHLGRPELTVEKNAPSRVAIVTGGSRGIGRAIVESLANNRFGVAFCYASNTDAAVDVVGNLPRGARVFHKRVDVRDAAQVRAFVDDVRTNLGEPDTLITCAGITRDKPLVMMNEDDWADVIDINLTGAYNFCRAVVFQFMKQRAGSMILLGSVAGVYGNAAQANYSASKAGIQGMGLALAKELGAYGIRINVIAPGFINTDMTSVLSQKVRDKALRSIPAGRFGEAGEVAELVSFLVSDNASYITGQIIGVDGGLTL